MAQSPLVILVGAAATILKGRGALQDINQLAVAEPCVKWAGSVAGVRDIVTRLEDAFQIARSDRPGPCFVEFPLDTLYPAHVVSKELGIDRPFSGGILKRLQQLYAVQLLCLTSKDIYDITLIVCFVMHGMFAHMIHTISHVLLFRMLSLNKQQQQLAKQNSLCSLLEANLCLMPVRLIILDIYHFLTVVKVDELAAAVDRLNIPVYLSGMARGLLGRTHRLYLRHKRYG